MYKCKYFKINELIPDSILKEFGEQKCWLLIDDRLLKTIDSIREKFGSTSINRKGISDQCGYRTNGAKTSQHSNGRAADCHFSGNVQADYDKKREYILSHQNEFPFITGIEIGVNWLHIDVGNREPNNGNIQTFTKG